MSLKKIGIIGGSGLGQILASQEGATRHDVQTPFGRPSDAIIEVRWGQASVCLLSRHGPGHLLNPSSVPYRANLFALKELGCTHVIASGAVGSLREEFRPRDLVIPDQIIDKTSRRVGTFYDGAAVHVEFAEPFCPVLRQVLLEAGKSLPDLTPSQAEANQQATQSPSPAINVHDGGCYVCMEGPAFSTRAESLMHRLWGGDLIGMTAMPEAKLAREAELSYALVALVTDYDCWRNVPLSSAGAAQATTASKQELLKEIIGNLQAATENAMNLIRRAVELLVAKADSLPPSPAHQALELGIWSARDRIDPVEVQRLSPLWMKYFEKREGA